MLEHRRLFAVSKQNDETANREAREMSNSPVARGQKREDSKMFSKRDCDGDDELAVMLVTGIESYAGFPYLKVQRILGFWV